jgi:hypothetical protein
MNNHEHKFCQTTWRLSANVRASQTNHAYKMFTRSLGMIRVLTEVES